MTEIPTWQCVVAAALRRGDGRWLMHRRPIHKQHGGLWEFPGGKVDPGETPVNALIRELAEELGITVLPADMEPSCFAQEDRHASVTSIVILLYIVRHWEGEPLALEQGAQLGWFLPHEMDALERPPLDVALCRLLGRSAAICKDRG